MVTHCLRTALFMFLLNGQAGLVFLDRPEHCGSHSTHESTFRIVSSFTFFPCSSWLRAGRQWSLLLGEPPGTMLALKSADPVLLTHSPTVVFAGGGLCQCALSN